LLVADEAGASTGTVTIAGGGSALTLTGAAIATIGAASTSTATMNVENGGTLNSGTGTTTLNATGTINIDGGNLNLAGPLARNGGALNFNSGALSIVDNWNVGVGGLLGLDVTFDTTRRFTTSATTTIDTLHTLTLNGATFSTGALVNNGTLAFNSGTLTITGASGLTIGGGGPLGSALTLGAGRRLNVINTTTINGGAVVLIESGGAFTSGTLANSGTVVLDGAATVLVGTAVNNSGLIRGEGIVSASVANAAGGEIRAQAGKTLTLTGVNATNAGMINLQAGTAEFLQPLVNGAAGQILGRGTLVVGGSGLTNNGQVALSSDISDVFGDVMNNTGNAAVGITVSGNADATFWGDVTNTSGLFRVSSGSSATFFGTYGGGGISGAGDVYFEADVTPGFSPASVTFGGNVSLSPTASLKIEIGGTMPGNEYDRLSVAGSALLDGIVDVALINGFTPTGGQQFTIVTAGSIVNNGLALAAADASLFNLLVSGTSVILQAIGLPGDYNQNGIVDAADYVVWRKNQGTTIPLPNDLIGGTIGTAQYDQWRTHYGQTAGSGLGGGATVSVPEPATVVMFFTGVLALCPRRRAKVS
jgi:hypothetical protein